MPAPLIAPVNGYRTSRFGPRDTGIKGATTYHYGIDIGGVAGHDVLAPQSGKVLAVQRKVADARGLYVIIRGTDADFLVQHLASIPSGIKVGKKVRLGQAVGVVGATSTLKLAAHLHFEVHPHPKSGTNALADILRARTAADPEKFYPKHGQPKPWERPGEGVVMRVKHKSKHLVMRSYFEDRKTVAALRPGGFKVKTVLSTWGNWTITKANRYYATSRLEKA